MYLSSGPPIPPAPHLLPYLYPSGLYPPPPLSLLHNNQAAAAAAAGLGPGINPGLLFNAQLALAAQHPALFGHYAGHGPISPMHGLKGHRFSPYNLPGSLGSAFEAVTPGSNSVSNRSLSTSPRARPPSSSPTTSTRPLSVSPNHSPTLHQQQQHLHSPPSSVQSPQNNNNNRVQSTPSELKSIEKMVNGLEVQHTVAGAISNGGSEDKVSGGSQ